MSWQLCPKCEGAWQLTGAWDCNICKGHGIISEFTGKPPKDEVAGLTQKGEQ